MQTEDAYPLLGLTCGGLLRHALHPLAHASPLVGVLCQALLDDAEHNLELWVVSAGGVWQSAILGVCQLCLAALCIVGSLVSTDSCQHACNQGQCFTKTHNMLVKAQDFMT